MRDASPEDVIEYANFFDKHLKSLKKDHAYYFQIQTHLFVTELLYCDFVVWTKGSIHYERILPDATLWDKCLEKADNFFGQIILPELLSKMYTSKCNKENICDKSPILVKINKV